MSELKRKLRTFFGTDSLPTLAKSTELAKPPSKSSQKGMDTFRAFPAQFEALAGFIVQTAEETSAETAQSYVGHLRSYHVDCGLSTAIFSDERIKRILRGAAHKHGKKPIHERLEITKEILQAILVQLDCMHDDINLRAAYCTAFAAFLRMGEFTWKAWDDQSHIQYLSRSSVQFVPDGVLLQLPASKTDPFREGIVIPLSPSEDATCPVAALCELFNRYPKSASAPQIRRSKLVYQERTSKRWGGGKA